MPKKRLARFLVTPNAALPAGTPLFAGHFVVGQAVDIIGKTYNVWLFHLGTMHLTISRLSYPRIDHGFQGVMKRWDFAGGPASHGSTKFHRKGGSIGHGRDKARVMPGKKMPGHMGSEWRCLRGAMVCISCSCKRVFLHTNTIACVPLLDHASQYEAQCHLRQRTCAGWNQLDRQDLRLSSTAKVCFDNVVRPFVDTNVESSL